MSAFVSVRRSLRDLLGSSYVDAVCGAAACLRGGDPAAYRAVAEDPVDFYPADLQARLAQMLPQVGEKVVPELAIAVAGWGSTGFEQATRRSAAPLSALGYYRIGEDGRLYLTTKSEHYHVPVGHDFPGYRLIAHARALGIPNATHNNTRGYITRLLEDVLVRAANGLAPDDEAGLQSLREGPAHLFRMNRVLNLETGSLAVEAALKMMLARFYRMQPDLPRPPYEGQTPVFVVIGTDSGEFQANYHGTTVLAQLLRGLWADLSARLESTCPWKVVAVRPNRCNDLDEVFSAFMRGGFRIAGFVHEIVMMNYGGRLLNREFLQHAYELCERHEVPSLADEIQSCLWARRLFLFHEYGLRPSCVALGKGFPGGEYPASRLVFSSALDTLPQFASLVTNGQEELASLAYLITLTWARENAAVTARLGETYEARMRDLARRHAHRGVGVDGWRHLLGLRFSNLIPATGVVERLVRRGLDVSVQTYKTDCPPVLLTKLPLIADQPMIEFVIAAFEEALR